MNCDYLIDVILAIGRVSVLIVGVFAGIFSIYLGWSLYRDRTTSKTEGELTLRELKLTLTAAGPGVFLALFGAYLLVSIVNHKVDLSSSEPPGAKPTLHIADNASGFMTVAASPASSGAVLKPVTTDGQNLPAPCLVRQRTRVLFEGAAAPTAVEIEESLEVAAKVVAVAATQTSDDSHKAKMRRAAALLQELRSGVVKLPEQR